MKPSSIRRFDLLYLASIALSAAAYVLSYDTLVTNVEARTAAAGLHLGAGTVLATIAISIGLSLLLWFLASPRRLAVAKWIIVLLFVLGLTGVPGLFTGPWTVLKTLSVLGLLLQSGAIFYLFQPDAKAWFAGHNAAPAETDSPAD